MNVGCFVPTSVAEASAGFVSAAPNTKGVEPEEVVAGKPAATEVLGTKVSRLEAGFAFSIVVWLEIVEANNGTLPVVLVVVVVAENENPPNGVDKLGKLKPAEGVAVAAFSTVDVVVGMVVVKGNAGNVGKGEVTPDVLPKLKLNPPVDVDVDTAADAGVILVEGTVVEDCALVLMGLLKDANAVNTDCDDNVGAVVAIESDVDFGVVLCPKVKPLALEVAVTLAVDWEVVGRDAKLKPANSLDLVLNVEVAVIVGDKKGTLDVEVMFVVVALIWPAVKPNWNGSVAGAASLVLDVSLAVSASLALVPSSLFASSASAAFLVGATSATVKLDVFEAWSNNCKVESTLGTDALKMLLVEFESLSADNLGFVTAFAGSVSSSDSVSSKAWPIMFLTRRLSRSLSLLIACGLDRSGLLISSSSTPLSKALGDFELFASSEYFGKTIEGASEAADTF